MRLILLIVLSLYLNSSFAQGNSYFDDFENNSQIEWVADDSFIDTAKTNPFPQTSNQSAMVLELKDDGGQYANIRFDAKRNFDLSDNFVFTFKIYAESSTITGTQNNQVSLKLQNSDLIEPWSTQTEIIKNIQLDRWEELTFDFKNDNFINIQPGQVNPSLRTDFNRVLIQVNGENNNDKITVYIDDFSYVDTLKSGPIFNKLVWSDEFDGSGAVDDTKWFHQTQLPSGGSWFNGEVQHYTNRLENTYLDDGKLHLVAKREQFTDQGHTKSFTSARLNSKYAFQYGRVEVRAKLPTGVGTWPAIWTLGANINETGNYFGNTYGSVGWPVCGEIDIMEQNGWNKTNLIGHLHYSNSNTNSYQNEGGTTYIADSSGEYHIYSLIWTENTIQILLDDVVFFERENSQEIPYDNPHYLLLNIAMGGNLGGNVPSSFSEAIMEIDYVRVYEESFLSIQDSSMEDMVIYPNPTDNNIKVKVPRNLIGTKLKIYSTLGRKLAAYTLSETDSIFDISSFKSGIYFLRFESKLGVYTKEIIKK